MADKQWTHYSGVDAVGIVPLSSPRSSNWLAFSLGIIKNITQISLIITPDLLYNITYTGKGEYRWQARVFDKESR